jgi:hypothetical protein
MNFFKRENVFIYAFLFGLFNDAFRSPDSEAVMRSRCSAAHRCAAEAI